MDDIRQERPNEVPISNIDNISVKAVSKQNIWHTRREIYAL